ncbi:VanZ family protein [Oceanobacillus sp. Castelsardo]|uniref:VanZ family protein n=1 Tax=Oceanobacillus sp. Castelsardo TaxID=1851204 RepID=UPI000837E7E8|nr:VanZ family protein [Oceanobacillus sp. Castelsardo]
MRKYWYWILTLGWMGIIYYSSSTPYEKQDMRPFLGNLIDLSFLEPALSWISFTYHQSVVSVETLGVAGFIEFFIRKGAHFTVFFLLTCLFYIAIKRTTRIPKIQAILISFLLTSAYAIVDEIHQGITPNRTPYIGDVFIDVFGAIVAVICIVIFRKIRKA